MPAIPRARLRAGKRSTRHALAQRVLGGLEVRLTCTCYPRRCHADGIARAVRARVSAASRKRRR